MREKMLAVLLGSAALAVGIIINYFGDRILGVRLELYWGVTTYTPAWVADLFLVPTVAGVFVSIIYGFGGKYIAMAGPLLLQSVYYWQSLYGSVPVADDVHVLPWVYWVLLVVVAMEFAGIGGFIGEVLIKKTFGRTPRHLLYKKAERAKK